MKRAGLESGSSRESEMKRVALVVGVNRYEDPEIENLEYAEADATNFYGFLNRVHYDDVRQLLRPDADQILNCAQKLVRSLSSGDLFLFFFSGHGVEYEGRHLLLCPEARHKRLQYFQHTVPVNLLKDETARTGVARVFVLDACRKNLLKTKEGLTGGFRGEKHLRDIVAASTSGADGLLAILCACAEGGQAREDSRLGQGLFSKALLEEFESAFKSGQELKLDARLGQHLADRMVRWAQEIGLSINQQPWIQTTFGEFPPLLGRQALSASQLISAPDLIVDDPSRVVLKEIKLPPPVIEVKRVEKPQIQVPGNSPIPEDILELECQVEDLERTLQQLENDTHPGLRLAQDQLAAADAQWQALKKDLDGHTPDLPELDANQKKQLVEEVERNPQIGLTRLCQRYQQFPGYILLPYLYRLRNAEMAKRILDRLRNEYAASKQVEQSRLEQQWKPLKQKLLTRQEEDFQSLVGRFFEKLGELWEFPEEEWGKIEATLMRRRYRWEPAEIYRKAEQIFDERVWNRVRQLDTPEAYRA